MGTLDDERKFQSFAHAAPPVGFEAAWRRAAVTFAQHIQPDMSEAKKKELQEGLASTTDPKPPLARWAGPSTHPSVGRASSVYYATWSTWSAVISLTSRAGELRSAPSEPDDRYRATG